MKITTYKQVQEYLEDFIRFTIFQKMRDDKHLKDPLERMRILLELLGNPQNKFKSVIVGGTSGKGSTAYLISHILTVAGYSTGFFMKPHFQRINERIQVNELPINDETLIRMLNTFIPVVETMKKMRVGQPSYFELLVAMAFQYFAKKQVDIAIVEVGMGGEYDATNTLEPLVVVLTKVSLDHTEYLGKTITRIAQTKAGIIKQYQVESIKYKGRFITEPIVVTGVKQPSVIRIVENRCKQVGSSLFRLGKDFDYAIRKVSVKGSVFDFRDKNMAIINMQLSLIGKYQVENASLAIETALKLQKFGFIVEEDDIRKALSSAFFLGHFEVVDYKNKKVILDGAHNPEKMKAFISSFKKLYPKERKIFILSFKKSKDANAMLKTVLPIAGSIIVTKFHAAMDMSKNPAMDIKSIKEKLRLNQSQVSDKKKIAVFTQENIEKAFARAFKEVDQNTLIVVTGSMYLVGEAREALGLYS